MVPITDPGRTTAGAQSWLPSEIDLIIEVPDIGPAACITSGSRDVGAGVVANTCGAEVTTSFADIERACSLGNRSTPLAVASPSASNENERPSTDSLI